MLLSLQFSLTPFLRLAACALQGHLCGILVGFAIGGGAFAWFTDYLFLCGTIWSVLAILVSVKLTVPEAPLGWIRIFDADDADQRSIRIENGVIVYEDVSQAVAHADEGV